MSLIRIESGDWLKNASIVGLLKVLEHKKKIEEVIEVKDDYIEFNSSMLEEFEEAYFETLISEHGKKGSWYRLVSYEDNLNSIRTNEITGETIENLNKILDDMKKIIISNSYQNAYLILKDGDFIKPKEKGLNKVKLKKNGNPLDLKNDIFIQIDLAIEIID